MAGHVTNHPSADILQRLGLGKLDDALIATVMEHLETCQACRQAMAAQSGDDFVARLRDAHGRNSSRARAESLPGSSCNTLPPGKSPPADANVPPELGTNQQYEVLRELGRGGMGVVYLARNRMLARQEVLKVVNQDMLARAGGKERFLREIQAAAMLSHPNVVTAYAALQVGGLLMFAMEYVEGEDLAKVVKANGPLPVANACYYARQVALGLQHAADKKMVHRDIKPQNLILAREGKKHVVKILDFGLAKVLREHKAESDLTGAGKMLGTPDYAAPEQTLDAASADIRADIYSLGCTLYYLLTGAPPFTGNSLFAILQAHHTVEAKALQLVRSEIPEGLGAVVAKMMAKDPAQRYQKPAEVAQALAAFLKTPATGAAPAGGARSAASSVSAPGTMVNLPRGLGQNIVAPAHVNRATMIEASGPVIQGKRKAGGKPPPLSRRKGKGAWLTGICVVGLLLAGLVGLGAGGVFRVQTKDGVLVVQVNEPNADVYVDGEKVTVIWAAGGKQAEIHVKPGTRQVGVKKDGFTVYGREVTLEDGGRQSITARLEKTTAPGGLAKARLPEPLEGGKSPQVKPQPTKVPSTDLAPRPLVLDLGGGVTVRFVRVPKGTFWMGWTSDKKASKQVTIDTDFELGAYMVTQEQWQALMQDNPSAFSRFGSGKDKVANISGADLRRFPVECVSWDDVQVFLRKLNTREDGKGWLYRLPREAEWEYACRNAATTKAECSFDFYFDRGTDDLSSNQANFNGNSPAGKAARGPFFERPTKVGSYAPNKLGLYDMQGNVGEWCEDPWNDRRGPGRVSRGGTWVFSGQSCRAGDRHRGVPAWRHADLGLRVARIPVAK